MRLFTALIRTHHITSRKKLQRVKKAGLHLGIPYVLIRYGGSPGIMYAEGPDEASLGSWVDAVYSLRYKDFQCVQKPAAQDVLWSSFSASNPARRGDVDGGMVPARTAGFNEVTSVAEFGQIMEGRGLATWWKLGMGYQSQA